MRTTISSITKLRIMDVPALDPIDVFLEDLEPRRGLITIRCYNKAWTGYWGGMGQRNIAEFFCSCSDDYLVQNLSPGIDRTIYSSGDAPDHCKRHVLQERRKRHLDAGDARELFDDIEATSFFDDMWGNHAIFAAVFGEEWWHNMPKSTNPDYTYLCRIVAAVQEGLRTAGLAKGEA